ncbi:MAG: UDP-3-O-[Alphaproteobacteria bacterium]|nr:UDP-3-O-[3-hydroxymyristoyl] N-acetylglucosamine deacetylase [Alphaproteobacteria bacterium]
MQYTIKETTEIKGIGLHSGCDSTLVIEPAEENFGIQFFRSDLPLEQPIRALYSNVVDVRNCTCIGSSPQNIISTIEHLMAALYIQGIDNAKISINNPEIPILDGSAKVILDKIQQVGKKQQNAPRHYLKIIKEIFFDDGKGGSITLLPAESLHICFDIEFPSKIVGHQQFDEDITVENFTKEIAPSRTFCEKYQVDYLKSIGLIKGGSLENAVVLDGETILNPEGFRVQNECVKHKVLDVIGDMYTSGYHILAKIVANKSGHYHNNEVLKKLFSSKDNYRIIE